MCSVATATTIVALPISSLVELFTLHLKILRSFARYAQRIIICTMRTKFN